MLGRAITVVAVCVTMMDSYIGDAYIRLQHSYSADSVQRISLLFPHPKLQALLFSSGLPSIQCDALHLHSKM